MQRALFMNLKIVGPHAWFKTWKRSSLFKKPSVFNSKLNHCRNFQPYIWNLDVSLIINSKFSSPCTRSKMCCTYLLASYTVRWCDLYPRLHSRNRRTFKLASRVYDDIKSSFAKKINIEKLTYINNYRNFCYHMVLTLASKTAFFTLINTYRRSIIITCGSHIAQTLQTKKKYRSHISFIFRRLQLLLFLKLLIMRSNIRYA